MATDPDDSFRSLFLSGARPDTYMPLFVWCIDPSLISPAAPLLPDVTQPGAEAIALS